MNTEKKQKNGLTIRLTESVVFLRPGDTSLRRREAPPSMLRGLLTLKLVKPTRISSIDLELVGKSATNWPEGLGGRRIDVTEEHKFYYASVEYFRAEANPSTRRTASVGPGASCNDEDDDFHDDEEESRIDTPRNLLDISRRDFVPHPVSRRYSAGSASFEPHPGPALPTDTPPYSPPVSRPSTMGRPDLSALHISREDSPAHALEESRNVLLAGLISSRGSPSLSSTSSPINIQGPSPSYPRVRADTLTRQISIDEIPENEPGPSRLRSSDALESPSSLTPPQSRDASASDRRGRRHSRFSFSFASVSSTLFDSVKDRGRSSSPRMTTGQERTVSQENFAELGHKDTGRGRSSDKGKLRQTTPVSVKERSAFSKLLKTEPEETPPFGEGWKEFKKGIYTYPISFVIPATSPPTLQCSYGGVTWRIKAHVHRPGKFKLKLSAQREVILISSPRENDGDEENVVIERQWESQLQYLISISGRYFYVGGTIPIHIALAPMEKVKVHRISIFIEERVDYYTQMKRLARSDPARRFQILSLKSPAKDGGPILPLVSNDVDAFRESPLYALVSPDDDPSAMASSLMGPGPWVFHQDFALTDSCDALHFTNKNRKSNIAITHTLKIVIRVERGDDLHLDPRTGKQKLFDIVVQTPINILSCRCNSKWTALPRYSESFEGISEYGLACPCEELRQSRLEKGGPPIGPNRGYPIAVPASMSRRSSDAASTASTRSVNPAVMPSLQELDTLVVRNAQFERLISGQESEIGEAPPAYDIVAQAATVR